MEQATFASTSVKLLSHTVPQLLLRRTSRRPSCALGPPTSLTVIQHTVPQLLLWRTSRRPSCGLGPPTSLTVIQHTVPQLLLWRTSRRPSCGLSLTERLRTSFRFAANWTKGSRFQLCVKRKQTEVQLGTSILPPGTVSSFQIIENYVVHRVVVLRLAFCCTTVRLRHASHTESGQVSS